jgi:cytochrome c-type biogenesis protein CcmH
MKHVMMATLYWLLFAGAAFALSIDVPLENPTDEARAQALFHQFRCVVCQSESVADSPADVAKDVRSAIRSAIQEGKSDDEISATLVASYGEFILMKPPFEPHYYLLWLMPLLVLVVGVVIVRKNIKSV